MTSKVERNRVENSSGTAAACAADNDAAQKAIT